MNASDTRNKKSVQEIVGTFTGNQSINSFFKGSISGEKASKRQVLVMDEVDGIGGNQDRGGLQELVQLIKKSKVCGR